jgi:hypothetical protein
MSPTGGHDILTQHVFLLSNEFWVLPKACLHLGRFWESRCIRLGAIQSREVMKSLFHALPLALYDLCQ